MTELSAPQSSLVKEAKEEIVMTTAAHWSCDVNAIPDVRRSLTSFRFKQALCSLLCCGCLYDPCTTALKLTHGLERQRDTETHRMKFAVPANGS